MARKQDQMNRSIIDIPTPGVALLALGFAYLAAALPAGALTRRCPPGSVKVGTACIDKYEASVWQIPVANTALTKRVQLGLATLADLTSGGATQLSPSSSCNQLNNSGRTGFDAASGNKRV
jgi:hypothetical protein